MGLMTRTNKVRPFTEPVVGEDVERTKRIAVANNALGLKRPTVFKTWIIMITNSWMGLGDQVTLGIHNTEDTPLDTSA